MNPDLKQLHPYPFEKLAKLKSGITPNSALSPIVLSIGEPKHPPPTSVMETLQANLSDIAYYPATKGLAALRQAIADWLTQRFSLTPNTLLEQQHILPVNGTREALFAFAQTIVDRSSQGKQNLPSKPLVLMPNPFYQIYEGAALLSGAEPFYLDCKASTHYSPDFSQVTDEQWQRCQLIYLCSPNNPTGSTLTSNHYKKLLTLADKHQFVIASDECYSEIYPKEKTPPSGLLQACAELGRDDYQRCVVFHSLSKRSNLPGLRSGFVAGDANIIQRFLSYRTYHGCAMPLPTQQASITAWQDEAHVIANRTLYREKLTRVQSILKDTWALTQPQAGFNFWAKTPIDDELFTQKLYQQTNITVLPGSYLSREVNGVNPGKNHVRMAMVAPLTECEEAAYRIKAFIQSL